MIFVDSNSPGKGPPFAWILSIFYSIFHLFIVATLKSGTANAFSESVSEL